MNESDAGRRNEGPGKKVGSRRDDGAQIDPLPEGTGDLELKLGAPVLGPLSPVADLKGGLEEIAEDMLDLLERVRSVEERQRQVGESFARLEAVVAETATSTRRQISDLRRDLLGERKTQATRHAFDSVVPVLDSLRDLAESLDPDRDGRMVRQVRAVVSALSNLLQGLGFEVFESTPGEPFDPQRMESLGFGDGEPGTVVAAVRPGYEANGAVLRPAGVEIGRRMSPAAGTEKGNEG